MWSHILHEFNFLQKISSLVAVSHLWKKNMHSLQIILVKKYLFKRCVLSLHLLSFSLQCGNPGIISVSSEPSDYIITCFSWVQSIYCTTEKQYLPWSIFTATVHTLFPFMVCEAFKVELNDSEDGPLRVPLNTFPKAPSSISSSRVTRSGSTSHWSIIEPFLLWDEKQKYHDE